MRHLLSHRWASGCLRRYLHWIPNPSCFCASAAVPAVRLGPHVRSHCLAESRSIFLLFRSGLCHCGLDASLLWLHMLDRSLYSFAEQRQTDVRARWHWQAWLPFILCSKVLASRFCKASLHKGSPRIRTKKLRRCACQAGRIYKSSSAQKFGLHAP